MAQLHAVGSAVPQLMLHAFSGEWSAGAVLTDVSLFRDPDWGGREYPEKTLLRDAGKEMEPVTYSHAPLAKGGHKAKHEGK